MVTKAGETSGLRDWDTHMLENDRATEPVATCLCMRQHALQNGDVAAERLLRRALPQRLDADGLAPGYGCDILLSRLRSKNEAAFLQAWTRARWCRDFTPDLIQHKAMAPY